MSIVTVTFSPYSSQYSLPSLPSSFPPLSYSFSPLNPLPLSFPPSLLTQLLSFHCFLPIPSLPFLLSCLPFLLSCLPLFPLFFPLSLSLPLTSTAASNTPAASTRDPPSTCTYKTNSNCPPLLFVMLVMITLLDWIWKICLLVKERGGENIIQKCLNTTLCIFSSLPFSSLSLLLSLTLHLILPPSFPPSFPPSLPLSLLPPSFSPSFPPPSLPHFLPPSPPPPHTDSAAALSHTCGTVAVDNKSSSISEDTLHTVSEL